MTQTVYLCEDGLTFCKNIRHGFFTRLGGVSPAPFDSLNTAFSSSDDADNVKENRQRVADALSVEHLVTCSQIHSATVHEVNGPWDGAAPEGDAMVTTRPGVALGILTADCVPVLFADPDYPMVAAAHCGWRGTIGNIIEATIDMMCALGSSRARIHAAVGPAIAQESYEVGDDLRDEFLRKDAQAAPYFAPGKTSGKWQFALDRLVADRLRAQGLAHVGHIEKDTYSNADSFFSYRRSTHEKAADFGRQISAIAIRA